MTQPISSGGIATETDRHSATRRRGAHRRPADRRQRARIAVVAAALAVVAASALPAVAATPPTISLQMSTSAARTSPLPLSGKSLTAPVAVFTDNDPSVKSVSFYLDTAPTPVHVEGFAPFDFAGTAATGDANLWNPASLAAGNHTIIASVTLVDGSTVTTAATFRVGAAPATPSGSGAPIPAGDLPHWHQVFADDFTTPAPLGSFLATYGTRWSAYTGPDTSGNGTYDPARALSAANGNLDIYLHTVNGQHLVSTPLPKLPTMTYGRYSVRFQSDAVPGYKAAWLLWPDDGAWPAHGEIDFPEAGLSDLGMSAFVHFANPNGGQDAFYAAMRMTAWHTATVEWSPGKVVFSLDGAVIGTSTTQVPSTPMHWALQTETQLSGGAPADTAAGHVRIDWVTAYTYVP
jgi:hypothetical protein